MTRKKINIGLFGFGCVGFGLYEVLEKTPTLRTTIRHICVKHREKERALPSTRFVYDPRVILDDPEINVVVELIDDAEAAFEIVSAALKKGKAVVSANKKMIAEHFSELLELQRLYEVPLLYEAACCASIPIIRNLEEYYDNDLLESLEGIVNGSTNYILSRVFSENLSYAEALVQAQQRGYAESDPRLDTEGFDAKYKLQILIAHAFGVVAEPGAIFHAGIDRLSETEFRYAREKGMKIKLVAQAWKTENGEVAGFVLPKFVDHSHKLFTVEEVFNGIIAQTCFADTQFFSGKGAGAHPTASAVLSDISALSYEYRYEYKKIDRQQKMAPGKDIFLRIFLRHKKEDYSRFSIFFEETEETYTNRSNAFLTGIISLNQLRKMSEIQDSDYAIVLFNPVTDYQLEVPQKKHVENYSLIA